MPDFLKASPTPRMPAVPSREYLWAGLHLCAALPRPDRASSRVKWCPVLFFVNNMVLMFGFWGFPVGKAAATLSLAYNAVKAD